MAVATIDVLLSTETALTIALVSITRKRTDCFKIIVSATVYYVENWQTHADIYPIPLESIINWSTDPETLYTKQFTSEHVWGEGIHENIYVALVSDIQEDIDGYMKEQYLTAAATAPINTLQANIYFSPTWTP
jgi:hypothetical protein